MKKEVCFVTGNKNKLIEMQDQFDEFDLTSKKLDLDEIQDMDLKVICEHKVKQAYELLKCPVIVEDSGFYLDVMNGLPGPFIKFFEQKLGYEALIKLLGDERNRSGSPRTCIVFYDGENMIISQGEVRGNVTMELSEGGEGFGFDFCFIPNGYDKTFSELGIEVKKKISQRANAIKNFKLDYKNKFD